MSGWFQSHERFFITKVKAQPGIYESLLLCFPHGSKITTTYHIPGGLYHVMLRGNGGDNIFFDDEDRFHFCLLLREGVARFGHRIHGFCLISNHVHLAIQIADESLAKIMRNISFRYTRWINKKQQRVGHLFQGRYKAILVQSDRYLLELVRYIHLNPVCAKLVRKSTRYPWSSHNTYISK